MFWFRERFGAGELAFTDARTDLRREEQLQRIPAAIGADRVAVMRQVHGADVAVADPAAVPTADALLLDQPGVAAVVRVADCVPVVIVSSVAPLGAVVHAGRVGLLSGVVPAAVDALRERGGRDLRAWIGPHACSACYEVPEQMARDADRVVPGAAATTSRGTPSIDLAGAVTTQLRAAGVPGTVLAGCTIEDERFPSYRRQGEDAGRFGAVLTFHAEGRR